TQSLKHRFVVRYVFNDVKRAREVKDINGRDGGGVHLNEFHFLWQTSTGVLQSGRMQIRADQALPMSRGRHGTQHRTVTTANLQEAGRLREESIGKTNDQLVSRHEPKVRSFDLRELVKRARIKPSHRVCELRRQHRDRVALRHLPTASKTTPVRWPN